LAIVNNRVALGIGLRVAAMVCMASLAAMVKWTAGQGVPVLEIIFFRNAFAFIPICFYIWRTTGFSVLKTRRPMGHLGRSVIGLGGMVCGFSAVALLPLVDATALSFTAPLFMTGLAFLFLKERIGPHRWAAVAVGFAGVVIMVHPDPANMAGVGTLLALFGALCAAGAMIAIRQIVDTEPGPTIVFYFTLAGAALGLLSLPFGWSIPNLATLGVLILGGVVGGTGQLLLTEALRRAPVAVVAPFDYTQLVWASLIGYLVWDEPPRSATLVGAAVVAASGIYILYREMRRFRVS